jgi:hypothetical protein
MRAAVGDLPTDESNAAHRAADRGPIPDDPEIRAAALRIANRQVHLFRRVRKLFVVAMLFMLISGVGLSVGESPYATCTSWFPP